jgi:hypothetical protein
MRLPVPNDWNEEDNGHILVMMCIPNSQMWRAIIRGRIWDLTGWADWDPATGRVTPAQAICREIFNSMSMCKLDDLLVEFKRLNAILAGEKLTLIINGQSTVWDYEDTGLVPTLLQLAPEPDGLANIATAIDGLLDMEQAALVAKLEELRTMLETRLTAETTAANTRSEYEQALLNAIENILGGSYEPQPQ